MSHDLINLIKDWNDTAFWVYKLPKTPTVSNAMQKHIINKITYFKKGCFLSSETLGRNLRLLMILLNVFTYIIPFFVFCFGKEDSFSKVTSLQRFQKQGVPITKPPCQMGKRSLSRLCYKVYFEIKYDHSGLWNDGHIIARSMKSPHCGLHASIGLTFLPYKLVE